MQMALQELQRRRGRRPTGDGPWTNEDGSPVVFGKSISVGSSKKYLKNDSAELDVRNGDEEGEIEGWRSISHLPILPPHWAMLPTDEVLYARPKPFRDSVPERFPLDECSTCDCADTRTPYDPHTPTEDIACKVYTKTGVHESVVEVQRCPTCPPQRNRKIGPDPRHLGIFNYNNTTLVTHELLDHYTNNFSSSETPFVAFCKMMSREYAVDDSKFIETSLFRAIWFAYVGLQRLIGDMSCDECGPAPETVIVDGVTLAFGRKHLQDELRPPTMLSEDSTIRENCRYQPHQQFILDGSLRKAVRIIMGSPKLAQMETDTTPERALHTANKALEHVEAIRVVVRRLQEVNEDLASIFDKHFGVLAWTTGQESNSVYKHLFRQVRNRCPLIIELSTDHRYFS